MRALIFDCDGVLVDTERDGHRVAFNQAFAARGLEVNWGVELYGELLAVAGGKERIRHYFDQYGWPPQIKDQDGFVKELHRLKTDLLMEIINGGRLPLRSGIARLVDEAKSEGVLLAICSTSNERAVNLIVEKLLGPDRKRKFAAILAGDIVARKKPDPGIYNLVKQRLDLPAQECLVIEDSRNGLLAAKSAGMHCVITISAYTAQEDFTEADAVFPELGDPPQVRASLADLRRIVS